MTSNSTNEKEKILPLSTEIRIYPSFAEIREKFNAPRNFKIYFPREVYDQIVNGSLSIEGIETLYQNSVTKANNLDNQKVYLRRQREQPIECEVVRANDLLLKDVQTGRFIRAHAHELEYVNVPEEEGQEVNFNLKQSGLATLSYLIQGIQWSPRYNLNIQSDENTFEAWADIKNNSKRDYQIKNTELFGGDVQLLQLPRQQSTLFARSAYGCSFSAAAAPPPAPPTIESEGELAGIYWYSINQPFILNQQSTFSLPFVQAKIQLEKYVGLENYFQGQTQKGRFHRKYCFESNQFLPKGTITVREDGRVVGQVHINNLSKGEKQDLDCGDDPDVSFNRQVTVLQQQRQSASYRIDLTIKNSKEKPIQYKYKEVINSAKFTLKPIEENQQLDQRIQSIPEGLQINQDELQPNQEQTFSYQIDLDYANNSQYPY